MDTLAITKAHYATGYCSSLTFSDGTTQVVDFGPFLHDHPHPAHDKYRRLANFKRFCIERGNVVWGRDWDLIFPISQLHQGYVAPALYYICPRRTLN